ncbi:hypothetical protein ACFXD5_37180 [Streptomyces sp. NPDC059385]|uniref:hypothetical protein n=1 Tax=Streptomyces sp. NPDC059385 TaxID=3346817 RepID=UPI0036B3C580
MRSPAADPSPDATTATTTTTATATTSAAAPKTGSPLTPVPRAEAFRRACRYEWRHLAGLRSTWVLLGVAAVLSLLTGITVLLDVDAGGPPMSAAAMADIVTWAPLATQVPALCFFLLVLGTGPVSTDLVRGAARTTWLAVNGRGTAYAAKCLVGFLVGAATATAGALLGSLSSALVLAASGAAQPEWGRVVAPALRFGLWMGCWALLCLALVSLIRSRIIPVLFLCMWPLIVERLLGGLLGRIPGLDGIGGLLPFAAGRAMLTDVSAYPADDRPFARALVGSDLATVPATGLFCLYTALIAAAGCWAYCRRDATSG